MCDARWQISRQHPDKNRASRSRVSPKSVGRSAELSHRRSFFPSRGKGKKGCWVSFIRIRCEREEGMNCDPRVTKSTVVESVSSREFRATFSSVWSSIFKDGLRWVLAEPWSPAMRSSPSRKSAGCSRRRSSRRRCTESVASSGNCRSSRGLFSLAARPGRSVFALAPAGWSCCRAAIDSIRSDYCCVDLSMMFPAKKQKMYLSYAR